MREPVKISSGRAGLNGMTVDMSVLLERMKDKYEGAPVNRNTLEMVEFDIRGLIPYLTERSWAGLAKSRELEDALAFLFSVRMHIEGKSTQIKERADGEAVFLVSR